MARSTGEAIATGLDTGFQRVQQYQANRDAKARQDRLDEQQATTLATARQRQADADALGALGQQEKLLQEEEQGVIDSSVPRDKAGEIDFTGRVKSLRSARGKLLSKAAGYDFTAQDKAGKDDLEAIQAGKADPATLKPGQLLRAATVATGRDPGDYIRPQGGVAPIEKAGADVLEGLRDNDMARVVSGLNVLHAPELSVGVGSNSPHGKIVAKQIVNVVKDPNSKDPENPRVIPIMRIFVNSGKDFRGPIPEGMPEGSTGSYDAGLTEKRTSDPSDPDYEKDRMKSVGMKDFMTRLSAQMKTVELLNSPQVLAKLQEDQAAWNPGEYLAARSSVGAKATKSLTTTMTSIPAGGSLLEKTTDASGRVVGERRIEGNSKPVAAKRAGTTQEKIDAINGLVEAGDLTEEEGDAAKKGLTKTISTAKPGGRAESGGDDKKLGRMLQSLKEDRLGLEKKKEIVLAEYKADIQDAPRKRREEAKAAFDAKMAKLNEQDASIKGKMDQIDRQMDLGGASPAIAPPPSAKPAPKVMKFDKQGNLVK